MYNLAAYPKFRAFDNSGAPLAGGKVYTYETGTSTPKPAYSDNALTVEQTNPIILDSNGQADIYLDGYYKLVITDSNDVTITTTDEAQPAWYGAAIGTIVNTVTGTAPVVSSGGSTPAISMPAATAANDGYMTLTQVGKLDGIETAAKDDQTGAEIKALYEAEVNAFTDALYTKLIGIEALADVTDATNVDAAGAVMNTDTTTASMSFVVDEDAMTSDLDTKVPTQQSTKAYADTKLAHTGGTITNYAETTNTALHTDLDPADGNVHVRTLTGNITFTFGTWPSSGSSKIELMLINGSSYTVTWPTVTWVGGSAPTLTAKDIIVFSKYDSDSTIYATYVGSAA